MKTIQVGQVAIGPAAPLAIIGGPCVAESWELCREVAGALHERCAKLGLGYIFKASFDKANRSSIKSYRGPDVAEALGWMTRIKKELHVPATTDIHLPEQAAVAAQAADLLQIPAFLCRQTDLLAAAAATGRAVNVKKGQFLSPAEMTNVVAKLVEGGAEKAGIMLTERGTFFGYNRLVNDFVGVADMMDLGWPVCFDATHSTQQPGGQGHMSGGRPERAGGLARAAVALGVQAIFMEVHTDPAHAKSDAATMLSVDKALALLDELAELDAWRRAKK